MQEGFSYETRYHFEYVLQSQFEKNGWVKPSRLQHRQLPVPARLSSARISPGCSQAPNTAIASSPRTPLRGSIIKGEEHTLTAPAAPAPGGEGEAGACPNEQFRTGPSAQLPDCRGYEQVTPVDKEGAQEVFHYGPNFQGSGALVGEDGEHVLIGAPETKLGSGVGAGQSPYFFTRTSSGWSMVAAARQPETGVDLLAPWMLFTPDLTQFSFATYWKTSAAALSRSKTDDEVKISTQGSPCFNILRRFPAQRRPGDSR